MKPNRSVKESDYAITQNKNIYHMTESFKMGVCVCGGGGGGGEGGIWVLNFQTFLILSIIFIEFSPNFLLIDFTISTQFIFPLVFSS